MVVVAKVVSVGGGGSCGGYVVCYFGLGVLVVNCGGVESIVLLLSVVEVVGFGC